MKNDNERTETKTLHSPESLAADAFARVCKHGDAMLGHGIVLAIAALAVGFGLELGWTPLWILGAVLLWVFGGTFSDARKSYNRARLDQEAEESALDNVGVGLVILRQTRFVVAPAMTKSGDVRSQAS